MKNPCREETTKSKIEIENGNRKTDSDNDLNFGLEIEDSKLFRKLLMKVKTIEDCLR